MPPVVRFAPSPTGLVHIGNIRTALLNWCVAKRDGGQFILRYDDTDTARSRQEYADAIAVDLAWLGLMPDLQVRQSERLALYDAAAVMLRGTGRLYPCYETEDELERRRTLQKARGLPPVYDRAALRLTDAQKAAFEAEGRRPHWRFLLDQSVVEWEDGVRGPAHVDTSSLSDPVLIRGDGSYLYTFTSVVDDIDLGVTHIIRGEDHVTNTAVQIEIFEALGGKAPVFAHHNLLTTVSGEGLSKRTGALSIRSLREAGLEPMAVSSLAVLTGTSEAVRPIASLAELAEMVDLSRISRAPARFDPAEIEVLNARLLHETPYAVVAERLAAMGVAGGEPFWLVVRSNVVKLADSRIWWDVVTGPIATEVQDAAFLKNAASVLPSEPWDETTWGSWTHAVKAQTGAKGKALFMPLRKALTGLDHGPELKGLLPLIGREQVLARLKG